MRNWTMAAAPLALALALTACDGPDKAANDAGSPAETSRPATAGPVATKSFALTGFTAVEVAGPDDVTIRRGDAFSITATGPQAQIDELEIKLDGTTLSIGRKRAGFSFSGSDDNDDVDIAITLPKLDGVRLTGSGSVDADAVEGTAVKAVLTGSGDLKVAKFSGASAELTLSGSGDIEIASGAIKTGDVSVTGSGDIDADGLIAETLDISITGSGNVEAQASRGATVNILGSGDVELTGGGTCTTKTIGSGTATCR